MLKSKHFYEFGRFRVEPEERRIYGDSHELHLTGKPLDILLFFLSQPPHTLIRRDQLIRAVWPDTFVEDANLSVHVSRIRSVLEEDVIEAVPGHGYRFKPDFVERGIANDVPVAQSTRRLHLAFVTVALAVCVILVVVSYSYFHFRGRASKERPDAVATLYQRALEYERAGDDEQARTTLDQALALNPISYESCVRAAYLSYELEEVPRASEYLQLCHAETNAPDETLRLKAQALGEVIRDNSGRAIELLQLLRDRYPRDVDGLYRFAELATDIDRIDEANVAARDCLAIEPENPYCRFQMMYVQIKQNRFDDVITDCRALPSSLRAYSWFDEPLGIALLAKGDIVRASEAFDRLRKSQLRLHGTVHFTVAKEWSADVLLYQGRVAEASRRIQQLMETTDNAPARGAYSAYLAQTYALIGNSERVRAFGAQSAKASADPSNLVLAAIALASTGDASGANELIRIRSAAGGVGLSPRNEHLLRGVSALARSEKDVAVEELRMAHELGPRDELAAYWLGTAYIRSGDCKSAIPLFKSVLDLRGTVLLDDVPLLLPLATHQLGKCYEHIGDITTANQYFAEVDKVWANADQDVLKLVRRNDSK